MTSIEDLVSRYVAVWNEPDPARRRQCIARLWAEDGAHFTPSLEARGYEAIEARVTGAHERFVRTEGYVFAAAHRGASHHDAVTFSWEMRPAGGGPVASAANAAGPSSSGRTGGSSPSDAWPLTSHLRVSAWANWMTSMLSKGFLSTSRFSDCPSRRWISFQE